MLSIPFVPAYVSASVWGLNIVLISSSIVGPRRTCVSYKMTSSSRTVQFNSVVGAISNFLTTVVGTTPIQVNVEQHNDDIIKDIRTQLKWQIFDSRRHIQAPHPQLLPMIHTEPNQEIRQTANRITGNEQDDALQTLEGCELHVESINDNTVDINVMYHNY